MCDKVQVGLQEWVFVVLVIVEVYKKKFASFG